MGAGPLAARLPRCKPGLGQRVTLAGRGDGAAGRLRDARGDGGFGRSAGFDRIGRLRV